MTLHLLFSIIHNPQGIMIIKSFSRQLKAAAETMVKAPSSMVLPPAFFTPSVLSNGTKEGDFVSSIRDFLARIPQAVEQRKVRDIAPGAASDPVAKLFR